MITTFYPPYHFGGDGIFVHHLSNELARRGHEVEVIHSIDSYHLFVDGPGTEPLPQHPGVTVHGLHSRLGPISPLATQQTGLPVFSGRAIRRILRRGFDVIHFHNVSLVGGPGVLALGDACKLYTMHEYWLECPTHLLYRFKRAPCTTRRCFACTLIHGRPPQLWRYTPMLRRATRQVDVFLAPSRFMEQRFTRTGFDRPVRYLPNFAPALHHAPPATADPPGQREEPPYFLYAGRLEKIKGVQTILPVFRTGEVGTLVIAGTGAYEGELRRQAGDSKHIRFLGQVKHADLAGWYRDAVALILPSLWFEVFPLVMLEAFRSGTPVICRNLGSPPGIVRESGGGLMYDDDDELRRHIAQLLHDPAKRRELGRAGFDTWQSHWTADAHIARYLEIVQAAQAARAGAGRHVAGAATGEIVERPLSGETGRAEQGSSAGTGPSHPPGLA
jgi:glycosyltransferase involved in cell wall biosynthesis